MPAGALIPNGKWKHSRNRGKYLFKVEQLSNVFQARFVKELKLLQKQELISGTIPTELFDKNWVLYAKQPFACPRQIIKYLSRYTHRCAISNEQILNIDSQQVTFNWKDYNKGYQKQISSLEGQGYSLAVDRPEKNGY